MFQTTNQLFVLPTLIRHITKICVMSTMIFWSPNLLQKGWDLSNTFAETCRRGQFYVAVSHGHFYRKTMDTRIENGDFP